MTDIMSEGTVRVFSLQVALVKGIPTDDLLYTEQMSVLFFPPWTIDLNEGNKNRILEPAVGCTCENMTRGCLEPHSWLLLRSCFPNRCLSVSLLYCDGGG